MSQVKSSLQAQFEVENPAEGVTQVDQIAEDLRGSEFYCGVEKFVKMLKTVALMRKHQKEYFRTKDKSAMAKAMALESKIDKALMYYAENEDKLFELPF